MAWFDKGSSRSARPMSVTAAMGWPAALFGMGSLLLTFVLFSRRPRNELPRGVAAARTRLREAAEHALALRRQATRPQHPASRTALPGKQAKGEQDTPTGGNFDAEGYRPVVDRTRRAR